MTTVPFWGRLFFCAFTPFSWHTMAIMAKPKIKYTCNDCGASYPRWQGHCESCDAWNSIVEEIPVAASPMSGRVSGGKAAQLVSLDGAPEDAPRHLTQSAEFNRVLGGGLVPGSAILIGGDPGIGKSTLLLQTAAHLSQKTPVLYFSGEESASQIQMRGRRLGLEKANVHIATTGHLETILATIADHKAGFAVIDSIQTVFSDKTESAPGTVSQVRLAANEIIGAAKRAGTCIVFVGHVTKEGQIAGPRVLEHMVDTVMYFEGDRGQPFRILRTFKNRFGATNEIGVFDMGDKGLRDVPNPSAMFLDERSLEAAGSAVITAMEGTRPMLMEVQALVSATNLAQPRRTTLGVDGGRLAMLSAVLDKHAGFTFSNHDIFLNIAGGLKVTEPAADLAMASAMVSSLLNKPIPADRVVMGELGLTGEVRSVGQMDIRLKEAKKLGFKVAIIPAGITPPKVDGLKVVPIKRLSQLVEHLF